ncbi:elongation factor P 5-aminopentanone reductase [Ammoniphilus resinae]|uniref:3-oxoacyl-[acyl-carrier protein] reductase n=1 Tax=Ammoniphilus resinae TaxID=861532 RepID=A0ABS4GN68_9BACL|nr:SDR family oxidoreductase [Ammoniphilus resinae]MBP1931557.1 3-oxoacyl-[acyl-carrier protein] reductase [Ammoniphilus resinae]
MEKEKWALVTGASGGIGSAISLKLAEAGYHLYLHYWRGEVEIQKLAEACREYGAAAVPIKADLEIVEEIGGLISSLSRKPDVLINNAGITHYGLFTETPIIDLERLYRVNVRAPFLLAQGCAPYMIRQQYGRIINISSIWGVTGASCEVLYSMTKGALLSFTKALAKELAPSQVTVNAVVPGAIEGKLLRNQFNDEELKLIASEIPMGRLGEPEEIASLVAYLLQPDAKYITGQVISPNGGWYT